ncbi:hypothetical protein, conserved [Leishmania tarentolae]|uniref:Uncharacterized protein n=1 Tax=Leishmania tarentolae TaxID=5689 RepID=A0A640KVU1_LEITA|nr:hypothetical protein, conserved [Leishmania tarentolae]
MLSLSFSLSCDPPSSARIVSFFSFFLLVSHRDSDRGPPSFAPPLLDPSPLLTLRSESNLPALVNLRIMPAAAARAKVAQTMSKKKSSTTGGTLPKIHGRHASAATTPSSFDPRASDAGQVPLRRVSAHVTAARNSRADAVSAASSVLRNASGSVASSGVGASTKKNSIAAPKPPLSKPARGGSRGGRRGGKGGSAGGGSKRGGASRGTSVMSRDTRSTSKSRRPATSRSRGRGRGRGKRRGNSGRQRKQLQMILASIEALKEQEQVLRHGLEGEEELELESYSPIYNVLLMEMVRGQVEEVNRRQRKLNEMLETFKEEGLLGGGGIGLNDEQQIDALVDRLRGRLHTDDASELQALKSNNSNLKHRLDEITLAMEKKSSEMEVLRANHARKLARTDVENDAVRAKVEAALHSSILDVERMKRELSHRIDIACASFRTPRYNSSMEALRELVQQSQEEVQRHHDELTRLLVSIGAKDTFLRHESETMHSNLPTIYRTELRKMEKDQLLNLLDVLSFQEGVVDTVGKAIYIITETQHKTTVV